MQWSFSKRFDEKKESKLARFLTFFSFFPQTFNHLMAPPPLDFVHLSQEGRRRRNTTAKKGEIVYKLAHCTALAAPHLPPPQACFYSATVILWKREKIWSCVYSNFVYNARSSPLGHAVKKPPPFPPNWPLMKWWQF